MHEGLFELVPSDLIFSLPVYPTTVQVLFFLIDDIFSHMWRR